MKKSLKTMQVFSLFVLSLSLIFSCKKEKQYSESLTLIPTTSSFVACFDLKTMVAKGEVSKMKENQVFKNFTQEFSKNLTLKAVIENPEKSGVDFDRMFLFMHAPKKIGISFDLKNASSFEKTVNLAIKESGKSVEIKKENGISYISDELNAQLTIVLWDQNKCLISMESKEEAMKIFTTKEKNSIVKNSDFAKFYQGKKDIAMWINYDKFMQDMEKSWGSYMAYSQVLASKIKGLCSHVNLEFNKGNITIVTKATPEKKAKELCLKYLNKEVDPSLLASTPEKTLILLAVSIKLTDYLKDFDLIAQMPAEAQDLLTSFKGDLLASVSDFSPEWIPSFTASATVNDMKVHDALLNLTSFTKEERQGYTKVNISLGLNCFISQKDNRLMLTSDSMVIASFISGTPLAKNLASSPFKKDLQSPEYCYVDLDVNSATMKGFLALSQSPPGEVLLMLKDLRASIDENEATSSFVINFKKSDKNILAYLFEAIQ